MAESPAHRFGQIIGELLEAVVLPQLVLRFINIFTLESMSEIEFLPAMHDR